METLRETFVRLALDETSGRWRETPFPALDYALAGCVLIELILCGRVHRRGDTVTANPEHPLGNTLLDQARNDLASLGPSPSLEQAIRTLSHLGPEIRRQTCNDLERQGEVRHQTDRRFFVLTEERYPPQPTSEARAIKDRLRAVCLEGTTPSREEHVLVALLEATGLARSYLSDAEREASSQRREMLVAQDPVGRAVARAIADVLRVQWELTAYAGA